MPTQVPLSSLEKFQVDHTVLKLGIFEGEGLMSGGEYDLKIGNLRVGVQELLDRAHKGYTFEEAIGGFGIDTLVGDGPTYEFDELDGPVVYGDDIFHDAYEIVKEVNPAAARALVQLALVTHKEVLLSQAKEAVDMKQRMEAEALAKRLNHLLAVVSGSKEEALKVTARIKQDEGYSALLQNIQEIRARIERQKIANRENKITDEVKNTEHEEEDKSPKNKIDLRDIGKIMELNDKDVIKILLSREGLRRPDINELLEAILGRLIEREKIELVVILLTSNRLAPKAEVIVRHRWPEILGLQKRSDMVEQEPIAVIHS